MFGVPTQEANMAVAFIQEFAIVDGDTSTPDYDHVRSLPPRPAD